MYLYQKKIFSQRGNCNKTRGYVKKEYNKEMIAAE